jgi:hypothetical protein
MPSKATFIQVNNQLNRSLERYTIQWYKYDWTYWF